VRRLTRVLVAPASAVALALAAALATLTLTQWQPAERERVAVTRATNPAALGPTVRLLTWNLGYAALDAQTDFFMDGGRMSRARSRPAVEHNLQAAIALLRKAGPDVALLQELDDKARRSFCVPERTTLLAAFPELSFAFATNYSVPFVPVPLTDPMGGVTSGIATLTRATPIEATSLALPGRFPWPNRLFNLKRVVLVTRLQIPSARSLVVANVHLSAFDKGGALRRQELAFLRRLLLDERRRGSLVIAGGDWNSTLPGAPLQPCPAGHDDLSWLVPLPGDWTPPGWRWVVDPVRPTVRTLGAPLNERTTCFAGIDGFLVSPGIEMESVAVVPTGFANSDHLPVQASVRLPQVAGRT